MPTYGQSTMHEGLEYNVCFILSSLGLLQYMRYRWYYADTFREQQNPLVIAWGIVKHEVV